MATVETGEGQGDIMARWKLLMALGLSIVAVGVRKGPAQPAPAATLTALDYAEINNLYGAYSRWLDFGESDPTALKGISGIYAPDGMFVMVGATVPGTSCDIGQLASYWKLGSRDLARGVVADKLGMNVCIRTMPGPMAVAANAEGHHRASGVTDRHTMWNILIKPSPGGASGFAIFHEFHSRDQAGGFQAGVWSGGEFMGSGGFYEDDLVKTADGWRFKIRRVTTADTVAAWRPNP